MTDAPHEEHPELAEHHARVSTTAHAVASTMTDPRWIRRLAAAIFFVVIAIQLFNWFFVGVRHLLFVLLLAWLFAIAMEPAVLWLVRRNVRRGLATGIVMLGLFLATVGFFAVFGNLLLEQLGAFVQSIPGLTQDAIAWANRTLNTNIDPNEITNLLDITPDRVADWASTIGAGVFGIVTSLVGIIFDGFTMLLFAFFFSAEQPRLRRTVASWLPQQSQRVVNTVWEIAIQKTGGYVVSRLILAIISAFFTSLFLLVIDIPYWLPLGIWVGVISQFIPTIGTYLGGALPVAVGFGSSLWDGILVVAFITLYQQIENYFFAPKISHKTMQIHPAVAFGAVIVGGSLGGAFGALIAIPIVASIQAVIETYGRRYELIPELAHDVEVQPFSGDLVETSEPETA